MKKIFLIFIVGFFFLFTNESNVQAYESTEGVFYDLAKGGTKEFIVPEENGDSVYILIEEISENSLFSVNNGNYKITGKKPGLWEASYYISIMNGNITRAYSPSATAITGSFLSTNLGLDSSKQVSYYLRWKLGVLSYNHYLRATISNNSLNITY